MRFSIISLLFPFTVNALSATTANTIIGTAPYLTFDGTNKATGTDELLMIKLTDGQTFNKKTNPTVAGNASTYIELPVAGQKFSDIETLIPKGSTTANLSALLLPPYSYGKDDDGDTGLTATGTLSIQITDASGATVNLTDTASACNAPYKLTLTSSSGKLETTYGTPRQTPFTGTSTDYYINPKIVAPYACFAQPNLEYGNSSQNIFWGPTNQWDPTKGFKVQDINTPSSNFPTTGTDKLHFNLTVAGVSGSSVIYDKNPTTSNVDLSLSATGNVVKVLLTGPKSSTPSAERSFTPTTFKLYSDAGKSNVIYSFRINKWFILSPVWVANYPAAKSFCTGIGGDYHLPSRSDYTNNPVIFLPNCLGKGTDSGVCYGGTYTRAIGGGLLSEWGRVTYDYYTSSSWQTIAQWTSDAYSASEQYIVDGGNGFVNVFLWTPSDRGAACVAP